MPNIIGFDRPIQIIDWVKDKVVKEVPFIDGLKIMTASTRFDKEHTTNTVRKLAPADASQYGLVQTPVTFRQKPNS